MHPHPELQLLSKSDQFDVTAQDGGKAESKRLSQALPAAEG
jgi:hypothetical protein